MSRSNPTLQNPAERRYTWKGQEGKLVYFDKEQQEEVTVKLPFSFMVIDELATIAGYSSQDQSSYWSNEVRSIQQDEFTVKTSKGTKQVGLYRDLADVRAKGAKYAKSIYFVHKVGEVYALANFKASGSALSAWIDFSGKYRPEQGTVTIERGEKQKSPAGEFYPPAFSYRASTAEEDEAAKRLDQELQTYLYKYFAATRQASQLAQEIMVDEIDPAVGKASPEEIADYNRRVAAASKGKAKSAAPAADDGPEDVDEQPPIDLSEIPF